MSLKLKPEVLELIACPLCSERPGLELKDDKTLVCKTCEHDFVIAENGIAKLVEEELTKE